MAKTIRNEVLKLDLEVNGAEGRKQIDLTTKTMAELRKDIKLTQKALSEAVPGTDNWKKLNAELRANKTRLRELTCAVICFQIKRF